MARVLGVDLPDRKRIEYALTYIYGVGLSTSRDILDNTKISYDKRTKDLGEDEIAEISKYIQANYKIEGDLKKDVITDIKGLMDLGNYRGLRHRVHLPLRGQKTKNNSRTRKGRKRSY